MSHAPERRTRSAADWVRLGEESLREHLLAQAAVAQHRYGPLGFDRLEAFLRDPTCLRYPTRLVFEFGEMAMHQFAQPDLDYRNEAEDGRVLYVRPRLRDHPELVVRAVAYMVPVVNYGEVVGDEECVLYGAALLGRSPDRFYDEVCALADLAGCEPRAALSARP